MPTVRVHSLYAATVSLTVTSPRPAGTPSHLMPNAKAHADLASQIRAALREFKHLAENSDTVKASWQIATHLATVGCPAFYAVRTLDPAGSLVDVDADYFLDILRLRYDLVFAVLPGALLAAEEAGEAYESNWQRAIKSLLCSGYKVPRVFIPGDEGTRDETATNVDLTLEMGPAKATMPFNMPAG